MKAAVITRYGGPEVLEVRTAPDPQPKPAQVVVRVEAAGLNFADIMAAQGGYPGTPEPPLVAGREFAGRREDTGERVMGYTQSRAFAEKIATSPDLLWPVPEKWSANEAAAFPVNYFTAYFAYWKAGLADEQARGKRVLIHAVAGGVGTAAVEIGSVLGLEMYGTASSDEKLAQVQKLGLQHPINYKRDDYEAKIRELTGGGGVDAVLEMLGGEHVAKSARCLSFFGSVITYGSASGERASLDPRILYDKQTSVHGLWLAKMSQRADLMRPAWAQLKQWIDAGRLHPVVGHVLPLEKVADAYRLLMERKNFGKVVLEISSQR
ncbi:MAG TPA: NADPH:quinone oxidoreductase family protein [Terriglobales bacterium]|jgi:NADPH:quinone reductase|nr:NADPH:quinone oxidoreductase family protein [Terriglobales bacterium]